MPPRLSSFAPILGSHLESWAGSGVPGSGFDFGSMALELFRIQFDSCPAYRRLCEMSGVSAESVRTWEAIPSVPTVAFQELELSSIPAGDRIAVFHSSGTSGQRPSRHFHSRESLALDGASLRGGFERGVLGLGGATVGEDGLQPCDGEGRALLLSLTPPTGSVPRSSLVHMIESMMGRRGGVGSCFAGRLREDGSWEVGFEEVRRVFADATDCGRPVVVLGTAFNLVHLLEHFEDAPLSRPLPAGSRVMETGGYKGRSRELTRDELHAGISLRLGVPSWRIIGEYGMSELSSQAYDAPVAGRGRERRFGFPPWARVLAISPETGRPVRDGETGLLRVLDLANVWSVLAIQTGDLGRVNGDTFELLGRASSVEPRGCSLMAA